MNSTVTPAFYQKAKTNFNQIFTQVTSQLKVDFTMFNQLASDHKQDGYNWLYIHPMHLTYNNSYPPAINVYDGNLYAFLRFAKTQSNHIQPTDKCFFVFKLNQAFLLNNNNLSNVFADYENGIGGTIKSKLNNPSHDYLAESFRYDMNNVDHFLNNYSGHGVQKILFDVCVSHFNTPTKNKAESIFFVNAGLDSNDHVISGLDFYDFGNLLP